MSHFEPGRCTCSCGHVRGGPIRHTVPCCRTCKFCGKDRLVNVRVHEKRCPENPANKKPDGPPPNEVA